MTSHSVKSPAELAGVKCPKTSGAMDKNASCKECEHYSLCLKKVLGALF
jgi:hypothetical protein